MKKLISALENLCAALLCILAFSVFFQIIARLFLKIPATWTTEIARAMFHIIVFLGMPIVIYEEGQMAVTMVRDLFKKNRTVTLVFQIIGDIFIYFFLITLIYGSYDRMISEWSAAIPTVPWLTYGHLYFFMFAGAILMLIAQITRTRCYLVNKKEKEGC